MSHPHIDSSNSTPALPHLAPTCAILIQPSVPILTSGASFTDAQVDEYREQDRWLPIANVSRIMKTSLPGGAKVSKEAKECVQESVSEFISFITSEAAEKCMHEKRKTINGEDILSSMLSLGFDNYARVMKVYLARLRKHQLAQPKPRPHVTADEVKEDSSDGEEAHHGKRKRKRDGEGVTVKRKVDDSGPRTMEKIGSHSID